MNTFLRLLLFALAFSLSLQAVEPTITSLLPRGGMRDSVQEIRIRGQRLDEAAEMLFYSEGIKATNIVVEKSTSLKASLSISKETAFGQHNLRVRTNEGLSNLYTFWVGPFPNLKEEEPNSAFDQAQGIPVNTTVNGVIINEDVDYFEINATKGQRLSVEVEAIRLSGALFDPYVAVLDDKRFELATSDDSELLLQDSTLSLIAPSDGVYRVEVRDSSYKGSSNFNYRLHVGNFPRPLVVFPAGGEAGKTQEFTFLGDAKGEFKTQISLPSDSKDDEFAYYHFESNLSSPSPNRIRVSPFPSVREKEPNNSYKLATVTELTLPLAFDGIISEDKDYDYFKFKAKKGQKFNIRAHARSVSSPLDPVLNLYQIGSDGKLTSLKGNDDANNGPDSLITFTFTSDGEYLLRITDHLGKGSPKHVYR
ncbi:MAG: peptidase, partial [Opitutae bacterium]|nr:peptidase [Opitutae bacterium]